MRADISNCRGYAPTRIEWAAFPGTERPGITPGRTTHALPRRVGLAEPVASIRDRERSVLLRRYLDPERWPVMGGRWRRVRAGRRRRDRGDRHRRQRLVGQIGDEHAGHRVFLAAQLREMN